LTVKKVYDILNGKSEVSVMAYETKVILALLAEQVAKAKTPKEAYNAIRRAANVEGVQLPTYEDFQKKLEEENNA
jgi:hypothetical protein